MVRLSASGELSRPNVASRIASRAASLRRRPACGRRGPSLMAEEYQLDETTDSGNRRPPVRWATASLGVMTLLNLDPDQLLSTPRAVRKRLDFSRPVPGELIREGVALALQAPSGSNTVTMQFVVVTDAATRQAMGQLYSEGYANYKNSPWYVADLTTVDEKARQ